MPYKDKEQKKKYMKEYAQSPKYKLRKKEHYKKNKDKINEREKEYFQRPEVKARRKEYLQKNKDKIHKRQKEYFQRPEIKEKMKEYFQRPEVRERHNLMQKEKLLKNMNFLLRRRLRFLLNQAFKKYTKTGKIMSSKKYGINYQAIIERLKPFPKDIENYHIDHIIPLSRFDFNNPKHIKIAFAPENHQWLTIQENLEKNNKLVMPCAFK